ncbi:MAG: SRPBCC domain-containing protein [Actinomycetota bacterium]
MTDTTPAVRIERVFDAPVETIWEMWAEPDHFAAWYGPQGATIAVAKMDVRVGGRRHLSMTMQTPQGEMVMWFVGEYRTVDAPGRLVYTESMSNEAGDVLSPESMGMPAEHPEVTEVTVELTAVDGGTRMVMTHAGIPAGSPGEMGWNMALDELERRLAA